MNKSTRQLLPVITLLMMLSCLVFIPKGAAEAASAAPLIITADKVITGPNKSEHNIYADKLEAGSYTVKVYASRESLDRPDTNIIVTSGKQKVVITDVQSKGFKEKPADSPITSDGNARVTIQLGPDKVFSGGLRVELSKVVAPATAKSIIPAVAPSALPQTGLDTLTMLAVILTTTAIGYTACTVRTSRILS